MSKTCTHCNTQHDETMQKIPFVAVECENMRQYKIIQRLIIIIGLLAILLFGSNFAWLIYEKQFETVQETYEISQDTGTGYNNCIIKGGEVYNGQTED